MRHFSRLLVGAVRDLLPVVLVVLFFQLVVLNQALPQWENILGGLVLVVFGLAFFVYGLEVGLFPLGENMTHALVRKGNIFWLLAFAFAIGFGANFAEPTIVAIAKEAAKAAETEHFIPANHRQEYALSLRLLVAIAVGAALVLGVIRLLKGWPIHYVIIIAYALIIGLTAIAPREVIGYAYDFGGVATSTISVPLMSALGLGLAGAIKGRNPLHDGFGMVAFASFMPMLFILAYAIIS